MHPADVSSHNKALASQHEKRVTALAMSINSLHLLVQHTFLKPQVFASGWHIKWQLDLRATGLYVLSRFE